MAATDRERDAMARALSLAPNGPVGVNPQVGAVILSPVGDVLAEGWHHGAGTPHAEVDALSKLSPGAAQGATAVVTLEPCAHTGRTGPCAQALIDAGVARVIYAVTDPNVEAAGGAIMLREAGVDVVAGLAEHEAATGEQVVGRCPGLAQERRFDRRLAMREHLGDPRLQQRTVVRSEELQRVHPRDFLGAVTGGALEVLVPAQEPALLVI